MIISDYMYLEVTKPKKLGDRVKIDTEYTTLKHIKSIKIENGFLIVYAMKDKVIYNALPGEWATYKAVGYKPDGIKEEDIFELKRYKLSDIKMMLV